MLTREKLTQLWDKIKSFPQAWDDLNPPNEEQFYRTMMNPANHFYEFGDAIGLAAAMGVRPRMDAVIHLLMFDRKLRGREDLFREALQDFARRARLRRLTVLLPEDNPMARKLALRIGFKLEGTMRKAILKGGRYVDQHIYGILSEELHNQGNNGVE